MDDPATNGDGGGLVHAADLCDGANKGHWRHGGQRQRRAEME